MFKLPLFKLSNKNTQNFTLYPEIGGALWTAIDIKNASALWNFYGSPINAFVLWLSGYDINSNQIKFLHFKNLEQPVSITISLVIVLRRRDIYFSELNQLFYEIDRDQV